MEKNNVMVCRRLLAMLLLSFLVLAPLGSVPFTLEAASVYDHSFGDSVRSEPCTDLIVGLTSGTHGVVARVADLAEACGGGLVRMIDTGTSKAALVRVATSVSDDFAKAIRTFNGVRFVEPNLRMKVTAVPNDPNWTVQWGPKKIQADYAWNNTWGSSSILVSVVDTGIAYTHQDLDANYNSSGYNWVENNTNPMDPAAGKSYDGHGTFCGGIIAAETNNNLGIAGVAQVEIMAERIDFCVDQIAEAIKHSADEGARIISCSFGDYLDSNLIHDAIKYAYSKGVLVVAGAGNDNIDLEFYPAAYDEVVGVSGTTSSDAKASFSNYGSWIELAAPAIDIYSTYLDNSYKYWEGTSFAGPHVAGAAALVWSRYPNFTRDQVRTQLRYTADDLAPSGFDDYFGYGRVNARRAVETSLPIHDLTLLYWNPPDSRVEPNSTVTFNAAVHNFGSSNAYNVTSRILANGTLFDEKIVSCIQSGATVYVNYSWTPSVQGHYNLTCLLVPVQGETIMIDNMRQTEIDVSFRRTIRVPADYSTISAALAAAEDGDTILVSSGIYREYFNIDKSISLLGSGYASTVIRCDNPAYSAVVVKAPSVVIAGFTICCGDSGLFLDRNSQNLTFSENKIINCSKGMWINRDAYGVQILHNVVQNASSFGLYVSTQVFQYCDVIGNNFTGNYVGLYDSASVENKYNVFRFNNFLNSKTNDVYSTGHFNSWDAGYPCGGNYYGLNFTGKDIYRGVYQNVTGMDGLGDMSVNIPGSGGASKDRYPLMSPWSRPRNRGLELRGWSVYVSQSWNASGGWRNRKGDIDGNGIVNIQDVVLITQAYGSTPSMPNWNPKCDLNGDGQINISDMVMVTGEYGASAIRLSGAYSWFSNGGPSANFTMWQQLDHVDTLKNHTIRFSFSFYPNATAQTATALVYYTTASGGYWVTGTPKNGPANQWSQANVNATIPLNATAIQLWIRGQTNFKAYIDCAEIELLT